MTSRPAQSSCRAPVRDGATHARQVRASGAPKGRRCNSPGRSPGYPRRGQSAFSPEGARDRGARCLPRPFRAKVAPVPPQPRAAPWAVAPPPLRGSKQPNLPPRAGRPRAVCPAAVGWSMLLRPPAAAGPRVAVHSLGPADVRWPTGLWADRFETCRASMVPTMDRLMDGTRQSHFLENFRIAAGLTKGRHRGPPWNDGDLYKWLEAAAAVYAVTRDGALDKRMDEVIAIVAKAQRADGYLHTPVLIKNRNGDALAKPFQDRLAFETYNLGHLFTAACVHHRATGKKSLLAVATKGADFLCATFAKPTAKLARHAVCPSHYMGVIELYRTTRE